MHRAVNSIGRSVGGAKRVSVVSVLSPVPGLQHTGTQTPRHQLPSHQSVISAKCPRAISDTLQQEY